MIRNGKVVKWWKLKDDNGDNDQDFQTGNLKYLGGKDIHLSLYLSNISVWWDLAWNQ